MVTSGQLCWHHNINVVMLHCHNLLWCYICILVSWRRQCYQCINTMLGSGHWRLPTYSPWQHLMGISTLQKGWWQRLMGVSTLLVLVLSAIRGHVSLSFGILRSMRMEEATTKAREDDTITSLEKKVKICTPRKEKLLWPEVCCLNEMCGDALKECPVFPRALYIALRGTSMSRKLS